MVVRVVIGLLGSVPLTQKGSFLIREREDTEWNEFLIWYLFFNFYIFRLALQCGFWTVVTFSHRRDCSIISIVMIAVSIISVTVDLVLKLSQTNDLSLNIFDRSCSSDLRRISGHKNTCERWKNRTVGILSLFACKICMVLWEVHLSCYLILTLLVLWGAYRVPSILHLNKPMLGKVKKFSKVAHQVNWRTGQYLSRLSDISLRNRY